MPQFLVESVWIVEEAIAGTAGPQCELAGMENRLYRKASVPANSIRVAVEARLTK